MGPDDWYDERYYENSPQMDPPGPASGMLRVFPGGSWRASCRGKASRGMALGFRLAKQVASFTR